MAMLKVRRFFTIVLTILDLCFVPAILAEVAFTNTNYDVFFEMPFNITWSGAMSGSLTLWLHLTLNNLTVGSLPISGSELRFVDE